MPKKTFRDNPALQFISSADPENTQPEEKTIPLPQPAEKPPEGYKLNPIYVEKRSRRLQLVLQPSLYDRIKSHARAAGLSVNEYVHQILDNATKGE